MLRTWWSLCNVNASTSRFHGVLDMGLENSPESDFRSFEPELSGIVKSGPAIQRIKDTTGSMVFDEMAEVLQVINILLGYFATLNRTNMGNLYSRRPYDRIRLQRLQLNDMHFHTSNLSCRLLYTYLEP